MVLGLGIEIGEVLANGKVLLPSFEIVQGLALVQDAGTFVQVTVSPCSASKSLQRFTETVLGMCVVLLSYPDISFDFKRNARGWIFTEPVPW
jgi:hypothetical protein